MHTGAIVAKERLGHKGDGLIVSAGDVFDDILEELKIVEIKPVTAETRDLFDTKIEKKTKAYIYNALTADQRSVYKVLSDEPVYVDEIVAATALDRAKASKVLLDLQLKKLIKELPGKQYVRSRG